MDAEDERRRKANAALAARINVGRLRELMNRPMNELTGIINWSAHSGVYYVCDEDFMIPDELVEKHSLRDGYKITFKVDDVWVTEIISVEKLPSEWLDTNNAL
jgi:nitrate/TMAO reductase-like tetraheme cytochrome c subunit